MRCFAFIYAHGNDTNPMRILVLVSMMLATGEAFAYLDPFTCFQNHPLYWLSVSTGVRINKHGMFFFDTPVLHGDVSYPCPRIVDGLCTTSNYTFFPCVAIGRTFVNPAPEPSPWIERFSSSVTILPSSSWMIRWA